MSDSHWITTNTPKGLKDNSGLFQQSVFPTNDHCSSVGHSGCILEKCDFSMLMFQNIMAQAHGSLFQPSHF